MTRDITRSLKGQGGIPFSAVTFEVSFLSVIALLPVSVIYHLFIHSNLISCSLIGSLVSTRSVLKMSTALRVLRQDCAQTARDAFDA